MVKLSDELQVLHSEQFGSLLSLFFGILHLLCPWVVSVQCPFYVVLLVMMHKKQCNVKRALASNTICITLYSYYGYSHIPSHCLRPEGDLQNSCQMRLPLVCFFLLIVFYSLAKEKHWLSFNDKCHHLCVLEMVQVTQLCVHQQTSPSLHSIPRFLCILLRISAPSNPESSQALNMKLLLC